MTDVESPLYIDNSTLRALAGCDLEAVLRYGWDYATRDERAMLLQGNAGHEALASYLRRDAVINPGDANDVLDVTTTALYRYRELYEQWSDENLSPDDRLTYQNTARILEAWFDQHPHDALPFSFPGPEFVEIGFAYPLTKDGDIVFCGRMDGLPVDRTSGLTALLEHKFTGNISADWLKTFKLDSQLSGYLWAAQQHLGDANVLGAYLNVLETRMVPGSDRKCKEHGVAFSECGLQHVKYVLTFIERTPEETSPGAIASYSRSTRPRTTSSSSRRRASFTGAAASAPFTTSVRADARRSRWTSCSSNIRGARSTMRRQRSGRGRE
jgi:hypothetical protein